MTAENPEIKTEQTLQGNPGDAAFTDFVLNYRQISQRKEELRDLLLNPKQPENSEDLMAEQKEVNKEWDDLVKENPEYIRRYIDGMTNDDPVVWGVINFSRKFEAEPVEGDVAAHANQFFEANEREKDLDVEYQEMKKGGSASSEVLGKKEDELQEATNSLMRLLYGESENSVENKDLLDRFNTKVINKIQKIKEVPKGFRLKRNHIIQKLLQN